MEDIEVTITGLSDLQDSLERLGTVEAKAIVKQGLSEGGEAFRGAMMIEGSTNKAELGQALGQKANWSKSVKLGEELSGRVRVAPKGSLPDLHVARGGGMQPKGHIYRRSLAYIVKMMEFGGRDARAANVGRTAPITRAFETYKGAVLERVIAIIRERLNLSDTPPDAE
jgi:hypothetical protein